MWLFVILFKKIYQQNRWWICSSEIPWKRFKAFSLAKKIYNRNDWDKIYFSVPDELHGSKTFVVDSDGMHIAFKCYEKSCQASLILFLIILVSLPGKWPDKRLWLTSDFRLAAQAYFLYLILCVQTIRVTCIYYKNFVFILTPYDKIRVNMNKK